MAEAERERPRSPPRRGGLVSYIAAWLVAGVAVAVVAAVLLDSKSDGEDHVALPPVREIQLTRAAQRARCSLRPRAPGPTSAGAAGARAGVHLHAISGPALAGAVRRGVIVIEYRRGASDAVLYQLEQLQRAVPGGTILAPSRSAPVDEVTATAYRRRLTCPRFSAAAFDAVRLFHGRYLGSGPASGS